MAQYTLNPPLTEADLDANPAAQLDRWLQAAAEAGMQEPTAMTLASVDAQGQPSARIVLFKGWHDGGPTFYTNYEGRKGRELESNPHVALVFWWDKLERQVRIEGRVSKLPAEVSGEYFHSRPRASQIGAVASKQSQPVADRAALERAYAQVEQAHAGGEVPLPAYWGGYRVEVSAYEFWQGRRDRLHDRFVYRRSGNGWTRTRLQP